MPIFADLRKKIAEAKERHDNRAFMEGVMAACAIVADADGTVTFSERMSLDNVLDGVDRLKIYDPREAVDLFNTYLDALQDADNKIAKKKLLWQIEETFTTKTDRAVLLKICWAISHADGKTGKSDYEAIEEIAEAVHVSFRDVCSYF